MPRNTLNDLNIANDHRKMTYLYKHVMCIVSVENV